MTLQSPSVLEPGPGRELSPPPSVVAAERWGSGEAPWWEAPPKWAGPLPAVGVGRVVGGNGAGRGVGERRGVGEGEGVGVVCAGRGGEAPFSVFSGLSGEEPPVSVTFLLLWIRGDPELSSSVDVAVEWAFTNRFLFLSTTGSGTSAGVTESGESEMVSVVPVEDPAAFLLLAKSSSLWRLSLPEVMSASVKTSKG